MSIVEIAKELACLAHAGQVDKAGRPYIEHVARVAAAVSDDPEAEAVAWLHDVIEDHPEYQSAVIANFNTHINVVYAVHDLTRREGDREAFYYWNIRQSPLALRVKLADIADNSDESRLSLLDEKTATRLRRKYLEARRALGVEA